MTKDTSAWDVIANYESHDIVRARYQAKHAWEPNSAHAHEIAAPFTQARHYYSSAAGADGSVKPLLLYYGVLSLSRGLVLFLTRKLREAALAQSHGLSVTDWQTVLAAPNPDFAELKVSVNGSGSFVELLRATGNRSLIRANSSAINHKASEGAVPTGTVLGLGELLARLPDVMPQFRRWKTPECVPFSVKKIDGTPDVTVTVPRWPGAYVTGQLVCNIVGPEQCQLVSVDDQFVVVRTNAEINAGSLRTS